MAVPSDIKNVAVVGATGNLGSLVVKSLLEAKNFNITAISCSSPTAPLFSSPSLTIKAGDYSSASFLAKIFTNQDAVVFTLHWSTVPDLDAQLIEAAAVAGVKWIFPIEYGSDNGKNNSRKICGSHYCEKENQERGSSN
jgi:hypothetical protein